jgi:hypothetical protein
VLDVVLAVVAVAVLVTVAVAALLGVTAAPLLVAMWHAERLGGSPARVGASAAAGSVVGLALAAWLARRGATPPTAALPLLLTWAVPVVVARSRGARWLGRAGRHERLAR